MAQLRLVRHLQERISGCLQEVFVQTGNRHRVAHEQVLAVEAEKACAAGSRMEYGGGKWRAERG